MAEKLRTALNELANQGRSQKDAIDKFRSHLAEILSLKNPELTDLLKMFLSICKFVKLEIFYYKIIYTVSSQIFDKYTVYRMFLVCLNFDL